MSRERDRKVKVNPRESPQKIEVSQRFGKIICPSRLMVCGPSMSGKSFFLRRVIEFREDIYDASFSRIIYASPNCLSGTQHEYVDALKEHFPQLELTSDLPNVNTLDLTSDNSHKLLIIDDMCHQFNNSKNALKLLTIHSHHANRKDLICKSNFMNSNSTK